MGCKTFLELLKKEVIPALGCTEPIAVALAAAKAAEVLMKTPQKIEVLLSKNMLKNAMGVGIPGTGMTGVPIATALGAIGGNPQAGLEVLKDITLEDIVAAKEMVSEKRVSVNLKTTNEKLYIEVKCSYEKIFSRVIIKGTHTNVVLIELNGKVIFKNDDIGSSSKEDKEECIELSVKRIYEYAQSVSIEDVNFLLEGARMNKLVSDEGLKNDYGLKVGKSILENSKVSPFVEDLSSFIVSVTAAASDARMAGCNLPVMSTAGSGNQGIAASLPAFAAAMKLGKSDEELTRALVISNLMTIYIKTYLGRLSPLCGSGVAATTGSSCAITYLLGGKLENINYAIKNMIANVTGVICDGAKSGCALKIASGVSAAVQSAVLAINGVEATDNDGIIDTDVDNTVRNLGIIGTKGMIETDSVILEIMTSK